MRVVIFGSSGLLGKALLQEWTGDEIHGLTSRYADLREPKAVLRAVEEIRPDWIILSAAYTDVDGCETNQEQAFSVNRDGAIHVANAAQEVGSRLVFLSSDYVFDGKSKVPYKTTDTRDPQSVYGRSKATAEVALLATMPDCCIVRTSWLFGVGGKCFPDTILKLAATRPTLDVVDDQRGSPTYVVDLARAIIELCRKNAAGIVHVTNSGDCTWFEFAEQIVRRAGLGTTINPTTSGKFIRPAPRPAYSVLSPESLTNLGITMPAWQDALNRYLKQRQDQP